MLKISKALQDIDDEIKSLNEDLLAKTFYSYGAWKKLKLLKIKDLYNQIVDLEFDYAKRYVENLNKTN